MILVMVESWTAGRPCAAQASRKHVRRIQAQVAQFLVEFVVGG
jgi:quinol monooxygenase YgiN